MQIFARNISKWWRVAILPMPILAFPALLMLFSMGNNLAGAVFGPPALWNRPWNSPPSLTSHFVPDSAVGCSLAFPVRLSDVPAKSLVFGNFILQNAGAETKGGSFGGV
jgi:hypothetical protein